MVLALRIIFTILFVISLTGSIQGLVRGPSRWNRRGPDVSRGLDNVFRFMSGVYLGVSCICLWMVISMDEQGVLVYLLALTVFLGGLGRAVSFSFKGVPNRTYYLYILAELGLPVLIAVINYFR